MSKRRNNPLLVGGLAATLAVTGANMLPSTANAQTPGKGENTTVVDTSKSGRAPGFPENLVTGYIPVAENDLGITMMFLSYPNSPTAQPQVKVYLDNKSGDAEYWGFNRDGVWLSNPNLVPKSNGKPFTVKIVDGKAVFKKQDDIPRGLSNPSSTYVAYYGPGTEKPATAVASNDQGTGTGRRASRPTNPAAQGILNNPDVQAALRGVGKGDTNAPVQPVSGTGAKVAAGGLLTFTGADSKTQSYKVERLSQGAQDPSKPLQGAFLYTAPDGKSGIMFTVMGTEDGKVSGMPLNEQALAMLKQARPPQQR